MEPSPDAAAPSMRIGRSGRLEAMALTAAGDHAVLVRVAPWATVVGGALLLLVLAFAVIGSAVAFSWLAALLR